MSVFCFWLIILGISLIRRTLKIKRTWNRFCFGPTSLRMGFVVKQVGQLPGFYTVGLLRVPRFLTGTWDRIAVSGLPPILPSRPHSVGVGGIIIGVTDLTASMRWVGA